jgi:hypothetical protein
MGYYVTKDGEKVSKVYDDYIEAQQQRSTLEAMSPDSEHVKFDVEQE